MSSAAATTPTLVGSRQITELLVPVSLGPADDVQVARTVRMAEAWDLPLRLVYVSPSIDPHHEGLESLASDLRTRHPSAEVRTTHVFGNDIATGIAAEAGAHSLLTMATEHADAWAAKGSIAERVVFAAGVPVLLFGPHAEQFDHQAEVLIGLDGSADAEQALAVGVNLARSLQVRPWFVQVVAVSDDDEIHTDIATYIQDQAAMYNDVDPGWELIHSNDPVSALASFASARGVGAVVLGARGRTDPHRRSMGSITMGLVSTAHCPILAIAVEH